jgi:hyperosmotically inducible protein
MRKSITALAVTAAIAVTSGMALAEMKDSDAGERPENYPADNSGRNQRDANGGTVTADDQTNNKADLEITQAVRKAVTADDNISVNGRNVKIVTTGGVVTLRGPVKDSAEKQSIAQKAKSVAGVARVDDQMEVATQN